MRCLSCQTECSDKDIEINDGCCPYCGAQYFDNGFEDDEYEDKFGVEDGFGDFDDDETIDGLDDFDDDDFDDDFFEGVEYDDEEFDEDDIEDEEDY